MNFSNAIDGYLLFKSTRCSAATIKIDRVQFDQFLARYGDRDLLDLTSADVAEYILYHRQRGLSAFTCRRHLSIISALYRWLGGADVGLVPSGHNPAAGVPAPKLPNLQPKALSKQSINSLIEAAKHGYNHRRDRALVLFLVDTCARASETCHVDVSDVDLNTGRVLVTGKGEKERFVYIGKQAQSAVWLYVSDERPEPSRVHDDNLFLTKSGYPLDRYCLRNIIVRLAARAGITATTHAFRHTGAIEHLRNGMDLVSLQHLLGHNDIATTRKYLTALADEDVEKQAQRTSPADNWRL